MSEKHTSWFHCGRCGSLFQSPPGESAERFCPSCGSKPSLGIEATAPEYAVSQSATETAFQEKNDPFLLREKTPVRKRKPDYFMVKLGGGWLLFLLLIVFIARHYWHEDEGNPKPFVSHTAVKEVVSTADIILLEKAIPPCNQAFSGFLSSGTPEARSQYVSNPTDTAARMTRFNSLNPLVTIDPTKLTLKANEVIHLPGGRAIETLWSSSDDRVFDAVFIEENGEWRLDWSHYIRFSDYPWPLFLAGSGDEHGEFRLLARERLADERKNSDTISIVLYAPRFGFPADTGFVSPEFLVSRASKNGRLLDAAFKLERTRKRVFGVKLPSIDPEGLIRVRVKVRRLGEVNDHHYELEDVVACHWYSIDAPGVEIPERAAKN